MDEYNKARAEAELNAARKPAIVNPPLALDKYVGVYSNNVYGDAVVLLKNGALSVLMGPKKLELALKHWDRDTFKYWLALLGDGSDDFVHFTQTPDGLVEQMTINGFQQDGCGVFERIKDKN